MVKNEGGEMGVCSLVGLIEICMFTVSGMSDARVQRPLKNQNRYPKNQHPIPKKTRTLHLTKLTV
jgi:hypothetical protein